MSVEAPATESVESTERSAIDDYTGGKDGEGDGAEQDYRKAFVSTQKDLLRTKSEFDQFRSQMEGVKKRADESGSVVDRLREALNPEQARELDPTLEWQAQIDAHMRAALEAEKAGRPMPITANLALTLYQDKIANYNAQKEQAKTIKELNERLSALNDPQREIDRAAFSKMDATIVDYVERLYGTAPETLPQRRAQYNGIVDQVRLEVEKLQKGPHWDAVRRSPDKQAKLVEWVVEMNQPPKVRQILEQQRIKETPISDGELWAAFKEAKTLQDPKAREKATTQIRQDIIARMVGSRKGGGRQSVGKLYG